MDGVTDHEQRAATIREKLLQLAAKRGDPAMSFVIEGFVNRCLKVTRNGDDIPALNRKQVVCIENEWRDLVEPTLQRAPTCNADGQWELFS